jgi:SAM-dependent methyltransferase
MTGQSYIFDDHAVDAEFRRLQHIERNGDYYSQNRLRACGIGPGARCLEAGIGAGSMARWMAEQALPDGHVFGVDIDDRWFPASEIAGVECIKSDIRAFDPGPESLDFIHARLFFMHLPDRADVLRQMMRWLRPGGWVVIADADISIPARVTSPLGELWNELNGRFVRAVSKLGGDATIASRLDALFLDAGLVDVRADTHYSSMLTKDPDMGAFLVSSFDAICSLCDVSDVREEDLSALRASLPTGENVSTFYHLTVAAGRRPT